MANFATDASGATWWPNLEPMQVAFFLLAEEITQVKEAIPWVRCASGNVLLKSVPEIRLYFFTSTLSSSQVVPKFELSKTQVGQ